MYHVHCLLVDFLMRQRTCRKKIKECAIFSTLKRTSYLVSYTLVQICCKICTYSKQGCSLQWVMTCWKFLLTAPCMWMTNNDFEEKAMLSNGPQNVFTSTEKVLSECSYFTRSASNCLCCFKFFFKLLLVVL